MQISDKFMKNIVNLDEETKERLIENMNRLKEVTNMVKDNVPVSYDQMCDLLFVQYFFEDVFGLEVPKHEGCEHSNYYRTYRFAKKQEVIPKVSK